jgi:hypothetical protein
MFVSAGVGLSKIDQSLVLYRKVDLRARDAQQLSRRHNSLRVVHSQGWCAVGKSMSDPEPLATARYEHIGTLFDEKFCRGEPFIDSSGTLACKQEQPPPLG